jgi:hypothetical protein
MVETDTDELIATFTHQKKRDIVTSNCIYLNKFVLASVIFLYPQLSQHPQFSKHTPGTAMSSPSREVSQIAEIIAFAMTVGHDVSNWTAHSDRN